MAEAIPPAGKEVLGVYRKIFSIAHRSCDWGSRLEYIELEDSEDEINKRIDRLKKG